MGTRLSEYMEHVGIGDALTKEQILLEYMKRILDRNQHVNLTAIKDEEEFIERHYIDSLAAAVLPQMKAAKTVMDLGTGGGFPGVPLAVAFPEKEFVLADSLNKRIRIIREFCEELGIENVQAVHGRAEELGRQEHLREHFDVCVSRAVADLQVLAEYCLPFVKKDGFFIAYKSADCADEVKRAEHAIKVLGGKIEKIEVVKAAEQRMEHALVVIRKVSNTPHQYPRRAGLPGKKPIE